MLNLDQKNFTQTWLECTWSLSQIVANKKGSFTLVQFTKPLPELVPCPQPVTQQISSCQSSYHLIKILITGCDVQQHLCARSIFKCISVHVYFYTANKSIFLNTCIFLCVTYLYINQSYFRMVDPGFISYCERQTRDGTPKIRRLAEVSVCILKLSQQLPIVDGVPVESVILELYPGYQDQKAGLRNLKSQE